MFLNVLVLFLLIIFTQQSRIIGGNDVTQFTFFTHIFWDNYSNRMCGGSLISDKHVLTAGHCIPTDTSIQVFVALNYFQFTIENIYVHPEFNQTDKNWADLAILELSTPIPKSVESIQIKQTTRQELGTIIGYGSHSITLKQIVLPIVSHRECYNYYFRHGIVITRDLVCVQNGDFYSTPL